ncbi:uncharacterized protein LOC121398018 [Xenopus laevis]|uniref:Uncharacterized protein LOC121398018 n=1 Tax=Xenopus laevis TaxID=8355 RepID=A0A8J1LSQ7_XENLA|nr:uncharacterized protein LOC121398018 [Xenopus laevis]
MKVTQDEKLNVSVTTRAAEDNVLWILNNLRSHPYHGLLGKVTYLPINNSNGKEWRSEVEKTSFALLYHTHNDGRLNITDVTDSLYNTELQYLSDQLGRQNVIVVIDDLKNSDDEVKDLILQSQPSISRWAKELLLFSDKEKDPMAVAKQQILLDAFRSAYRERKSTWTPKVLLIVTFATITVATIFLWRRFTKRSLKFRLWNFISKE